MSLKALTNLRVLNVNGNYMTGTLDPFFSTTFTNDDYFGTASTYTELNKPTGQPTSKVRVFKRMHFMTHLYRSLLSLK